MNTPHPFLALILDASLRAGGLVLLLLALRPWVRRVLGHSAAGFLWFIVLARLLLPWSLESAWNPLRSWSRPASAPAVSSSDDALPWKVSVRVEDAATPPALSLSPTSSVLPPIQAGERLFWFWGCGALLTALYFGARSWRTRGIIRRSCTADDPRLAQVLHEIPESLRGRVKLCLTDEIPVAALAGIWRPQILLPRTWAEELHDEELRHVFLHELGHARRGDLHVQWLFVLAQCIHWFNPLVWIAARGVRTDAELACDAWVLAHSTEQERSGYGHTLLKTSQLFRQHRSMTPMAIGMAANRQALVARVRHVSTYRPIARWQMAMGFVIAIVAAATWMTRPISAQEAPAATPPPSVSPAAKPEDKPAGGTSHAEDAKPAATPQPAAITPAPSAQNRKPIPVQIEIESKFFELSEAAARKLHLIAEPLHSRLVADPEPPKPGILTLSAVLDEKQLDGLLKSLHATKGVDLVAAPRVTTKSGMRCVIEMVREFRYPTEFAAEHKTGRAVPTYFETRNLGISMQAEAIAGPDDYTIDLNLTPEVVELEGFMGAGGQSIPLRGGRSVGANLTVSDMAGATAAAKNGIVMQPVFSNRKVTTSVSVYSGNTVVVGGLKREFKEDGKHLDSRFLYILVTARLVHPTVPAARDGATPSPPMAMPVKSTAGQNAPEAEEEPPKAIVDRADKPNDVRSPFAPDAGLIDVNGIAPGTKLRCPYTGRVFRVP